jgi:hypothetical protein
MKVEDVPSAEREALCAQIACPDVVETIFIEERPQRSAIRAS